MLLHCHNFFGIFVVEALKRYVPCYVFLLRWQWSFLLSHAPLESESAFVKSIVPCKRHKTLCNDFQCLKRFFGGKSCCRVNRMLEIVKSSIVNLTSFIFSMENKLEARAPSREDGKRKYVFMLHVTVMFRPALGRMLVFEVFLGDSK